jgi:hypothetical protein
MSGRSVRTVLAVVAAIVVLTAGVAWGAAGQPLIMGTANSADTSNTTLSTASIGVGFGVTQSGGAGPALQGTDSSTASVATGVFGYASAATSNPTFGVRGRSDATAGRGVFGNANAASGTTYGVYGQAASPNGYGVYGVNTSATAGAGAGGYFVGGKDNGVSGRAGTGANGVYGENTGAGNGVEGKSSSPIASGVYGENLVGGFGVAGRAGTGGNAVYGDNVGTGYAGYFEDKVHVGGNLEVSGEVVCAGCVGPSDITGKVGNADALDGIDSTGFIMGTGRAGAQAVAIPAGTNLWLGNPLLGFLRLIYACPSNLTQNGTFAFNNDSGSLANVFVESGGANPTYYQMNPGDQVQFPAAATGDSWHIQAQGALGVLTIEVASVNRSSSSDCHVQAQALLTS